MENTEQRRTPFPEWLNIPGVDREALGIVDRARGQVPLRNRRPLRIEAIAVAAGEDCACELPVFLECLTFWHPELRVYVLTDSAGVDAIAHLPIDRSRIHVEEISTSEQKQLAAEVRCVDHGERWSRRWIAVKLEALRRAVERWQCGVLFCDVDLVFAQRLPEMSWQADAVLSTHTGPHWPNVTPAFHGFFNAGLFLTNHLDIVDRWIELYHRGVGTFYEQQLLEQLSAEYVCDLFPASWNWGGWRWSENVQDSGRRPPILHAHIVGKWKAKGPKPVKRLAREALDQVRESREIHPRWAFLHCAKAAGSSFSGMIAEQVAPVRGFQYLDSHSLGLHRDWRPAELDLIRIGGLWGQVGERHIIHNHAQNWYRESVEALRADGWRFVSLYRPIRDRLVSFWFWSRRVIGERGHSYMRPPITDAGDIDTFLQILIENPLYETEWALPEFADQVDHWYPATGEGMQRACRDLWHIEATPARANVSANPGWEGCLSQGLLHRSTVRRIENDPRVRQWDDFARERGL